ncbi:oligopeptide/dipeptide ABC transporter ATP-binding protein [Salinarchaeum sp. Harcht-Bsk1]|uniref:ABC transporter ATP-binding protein n=1 Tax=Salinarchaeum sp. Harcht-Bsk1 TaxID=1333523 RepID=UPI00034232B2|nr:ABC transporter ATP-binding protein [Salinarchaeum sp. Harcht-Bsk1]AGN02364.1 oligopeptide/dipeptide ABC transporter ATP-binding protein [Salinarchaeum sp. Harcht-Bsk1]
MALLEISDLTVEFYTEEGVVTAVDELSYHVERGETFGVVGESGAGKSVSSLSLMQLIDDPGRIVGGSIRFDNPDTTERLEGEYPERVIDVDELRTEYDLSEVVRDLAQTGADGADLTGNDAHEGMSPTDVPASEYDFHDVLERGHAVDLGLIDEHDFIVHDGSDSYVELMRAPEPAVRSIRGREIAMIFQDAQTALNPVYPVGEQVAEPIRHHLDYSESEAKERAIQLLDEVGIPDAEARYSDYPHEFSGGMQQRAVIAMALSCDPDLLIADEPTTALDVTIEAQILEQIQDLAAEFDTAVQFITHDLGVIAEICDRVMVMYGGKPVEKASVEELYYDPKHPYTVGLMSSIPRVGDQSERLQTIPGTMPDLVELPPGCSFHPRCPFAEEACTRKEPALVDPSTGEEVDEMADRGAACLEYTGDLEGGLDYEVKVEDADVDLENQAAVDAQGGDSDV